jgi:hypothetical protein
MRRLLAALGMGAVLSVAAPVDADAIEATVAPEVAPVAEHPSGCAVTWLGNGGRAGPCSYFQGSLAVVVFCTDAYGNGANYYGPRIYTNGTSTRYCPTTRPDATFVGTSRTGH